jgi:hypothetical protein
MVSVYVVEVPAQAPLFATLAFGQPSASVHYVRPAVPVFFAAEATRQLPVRLAAAKARAAPV